MNSVHSVCAEAPPKYETLDKILAETMPATSADNHSDCMKPSNEPCLDLEQHSQNMTVRDWIRRRKSSVTAACSGSCSRLSRASLLSKTSRSTIKAYCDAWLDRLLPGNRHRALSDAFPVSPGSPLAIASRPLGIGEREISVSPKHDWTTEWGWVLRIRAYTDPEKAGSSPWSVDVSIFFRNLPLLLSTGGISWDRARVDQSKFRHCINISLDRERPWVQSSTYKPKNRGMRWRAEAVHRSRHLPQGRSSLVSLLSAETVYQLATIPLCFQPSETNSGSRAEIYQRTAAGRATRVMAYHRQVGYGNDITGQPLDVWHDGLPERFGQFIRPLMPFDPYCAEEGGNK